MSRKGIRFGVSLPWLTPGESFRADDILEVARVGEERGFDSLWSGDHLLHFPGLRVPEAWTLLTASSMVTNKVLLGTRARMIESLLSSLTARAGISPSRLGEKGFQVKKNSGRVSSMYAFISLQFS
jgi:hypothetical protein